MLSQMPNSARTGSGSAGFSPLFAVTNGYWRVGYAGHGKMSVMTGSIRSVCIGAAIAALGLGLAGCTGATYGTGTPTGMQTLQDLAGIADLGGQKPDPIKYSSRPALVAPPPGTPLPPPDTQQQNVAANWPKDPDVDAKRMKDQTAAREKFCADDTNKNRPECRDPGFRLPASEGAADTSRQPSPTLLNQKVKARDLALSSPAQNAMATKLFADARGQVAVDANGKPVRRYLTDPPSDYRVPDPSAPVEIANKPAVKPKWKWPWE